jgi:transcriptional regulator with XRE-family HTH domain
VPEDKKVHWELIRSELQRIFVVRLREEMKRQGNISDNALAKRCKSLGYKVGQSSVSRIVGGRQDPTLLLVHAIARALDVQASSLFKSSDAAARETVVPFPSPPPMLGPRSDQRHKNRLKKKQRR